MTELAIAQQALELTTAAAPGAEVEVAVDRSRLALTRFANSVIHQNVADDTTSVRIRMHLDGRTASGSSTLTDEDGPRRARDAAPSMRSASRRSIPGGPAWPRGPRPGQSPRSTRRQPTPPPTRGPPWSGRSSTPPEAWRPPGTAARVTGRGRSSTRSARSSPARAPRRAWTASPGRPASTAWRGSPRTRLADIDGASSAPGRRRRCGPGPIRSSSRPAATRSCSSRRRSPTCCRTWPCGASAARRSTSADPSPSSARPSSTRAVTLVDDPLVAGVGYDTEGTPHQRAGARRRTGRRWRCATIAARRRRRARPRPATPPGRRRGARSRSTCSCWRRPPGTPASPRSPRSTGRWPTRRSPRWSPASRAACWSPTSGTPAVLDPKTLAITGLTRNGVWLIEDGEVTQPLRNFRFTQSYGQALEPGAVLGVGSAAVHLPDSWVVGAMDGSRAAPGVVELHRRGVRLRAVN